MDNCNEYDDGCGDGDNGGHGIANDDIYGDNSININMS